MLFCVPSLYPPVSQHEVLNGEQISVVAKKIVFNAVIQGCRQVGLCTPASNTRILSVAGPKTTVHDFPIEKKKTSNYNK